MSAKDYAQDYAQEVARGIDIRALQDDSAGLRWIAVCIHDRYPKLDYQERYRIAAEALKAERERRKQKDTYAK